MTAGAPEGTVEPSPGGASCAAGSRRSPCASLPVVTIDGPAGAGKTTAGRELARRLGFRLVDTGAMYRALALRVRQAGLQAEDGPALSALLAAATVELRGERVFLNGKDVSDAIRTPEVADLTSRLTALRAVREAVTPIQRRMAVAGGVVLEGRDTGSIVCPDAEVKFYLNASEEVRARRRLRELETGGTRRALAEVQAELGQRDHQDRSRELAPLVVPEGAIVIDSTEKTVEQVVAEMLDEVRRIGCSTGS